MNDVFSVKMGDGALLSTHVQTPEAGGPWPVLVARTPYPKSGMARGLSGMVQQGYAVAVQDVRGTGESEGVFRFLSDEASDAADTGKWILEQPFCDGSIGLIGISYLGASSVGLAASFPENVKAAVWVAPVLGGHSLFHAGGALRLHHNLPWTMLSHPRFRELDWRELYRHLPLKDALRLAGLESEMWDTICSYATGAATPTDLTGIYRSLKVPGLYFGGFWDFMLDASLFAWEAAGRVMDKSRAMFLGPWTHNGMASETTRNEHMDYGQEASPAFSRRLLQWFGHHLKGKDLPSELSTPVSAYLPGAGWVRQGAWPCVATDLELFLGDGTLRADVGAQGERAFAYDPADPVPTEGGALWEFPMAGLNPGPAVVTTGNRPDVVVFQGAELGRRITALGPVEVLLYMETDAPSTDFTAKLIDVGPDGTPRIVADAVSRTEGAGEAQVTILMPGIGHVFGEGHRVRLDVSSSNFPKYDRNLNTGVSGLISSEMKVARQTVRFGVSAPSRVRLRVLDD